jgi:hypothetical protein
MCTGATLAPARRNNLSSGNDSDINFFAEIESNVGSA